MKNPFAQQLITQFELQPHPEGGYYREVYRSAQVISTPAGKRSASTAIYYLLQDQDYSAWHRIASDEIWHFYAGNPLHIHVLDRSGALHTHLLGNPLQDAGSGFQLVIPAGCWFAAQLASVDKQAGSQVDPQAGTQVHTSGSGLPAPAPGLLNEQNEHGFALVACTVAPGFEFSEFELADTQALCQQYPEHKAILQRLAPARQT